MTRRIALSWVGLVAILLGYIAFIVRVHPINLLGVQEDDSMYFSSAKAIAEGKGYVMPSLPGEPPAGNRYPVFYPWMLSWVWRFNPSFPGNANYAVAITAVFGLIYVTFCFVFLRKSLKLGDGWSLLLTAFCAFQQVVLFRSATILSDIPFAAQALGAMTLADEATERDGSPSRALACGILGGLSILTRTTGYPILLGILAIALVRRAWRQAAVFVSTTAFFFAAYAWSKISAVKASLPVGWSTAGPGFRQTWLFYTDYVGFRKLSIVNFHVAGTILLNQFLYLCTRLPGYFLSPLFHRHVLLLFISTVVLLWLIVAGVIRSVRVYGWRPIHASLLLYVPLIMAWNYPDWDRFLLPFLPLFAASLLIQGKWIAAELRREIQSGRRRETRFAAAAAGVALAALALAISWNFVSNGDRRDLLTKSRTRGALLAEKRQAYDWLKANSPADSRIIATEDGCLYLYSGLQSIEPIAALPVGFYEREQVEFELRHINDVAQAVGATFWLQATDDSDAAEKGARPRIIARINEIDGVLPEVFRSSSGKVTIYGLRCLEQDAQDGACSAATRVLFPPEDDGRVTKAY